MSTVTNFHTPGQPDMDAPHDQDVIADVLAWTSGPLPSPLEQIALKLFSRQYPMAAWGDSVFSRERNDCRRFALQLRVDYLKIDRWSIEGAHEQLAVQLQQIIFGDRRLGPTIRREILDYCETFLCDAWGLFRKRLVYPRDVDKNAAELATEDAQATGGVQ